MNRSKLWLALSLVAVTGVFGCSSGIEAECDSTFQPFCPNKTQITLCSNNEIVTLECLANTQCLVNACITSEQACDGLSCNADQHCEFGECVNDTPITGDCTQVGCPNDKVCDTQTKNCVDPQTQEDCTKTGCTGEKVCDTQTKKCVDPQSQEDCTETGCTAEKVCDTQTKKCVDPQSQEDCTETGCTAEKVCDTQTKKCVDPQSQEDCAKTGCTGGKVCNTTTGQCETKSSDLTYDEAFALVNKPCDSKTDVSVCNANSSKAVVCLNNVWKSWTCACNICEVNGAGQANIVCPKDESACPTDCTVDGCDPDYTCNTTTKQCEYNGTDNYLEAYQKLNTACNTTKDYSVCNADGSKAVVCHNNVWKDWSCADNECQVSGPGSTNTTCPKTSSKVSELPRGNVSEVNANYSELGITANSTSNKSIEKHAVEAVVRDTDPEIIQCNTKLVVSTPTACGKTGNSTNKFVIQGDILTKDKTYLGGSVVVENNKITYVGCEPSITSATVITCPDAVVSAGLINAHDHITYDNQAPDDWGAERFDAQNDWRKTLNGHSNHNASGTSNHEVGELRQLLAGTTSLFGSGSATGLLRNLDKEAVDDVDSAEYETFPLQESSGELCSNSTTACSCSNFTPKIKTGVNYGPHIGEGINDYALNELYCLSGTGDGSRNIFSQKLAIIHGVAATPDLTEKMAKADTKLIWSPRSNISLYGDTARVTMYDNTGVTIALGTDWIASGSANMLREYECADFLNSYYFNHQFSDYQLWMMGTYNAALALGFESVIGNLAEGMLADIAVFAKNGRELHRAVLEADYKDVMLVMLNGKVVVADNNLMSNAESYVVGGVTKKVNTSAAGSSKKYSEIKNLAKYPLFFDGTPTKEPTCVPMRTRVTDTTENDINNDKSVDYTTTMYDGQYSDANDRDGDGIPDSVDNCIDIFNPVRPQDRDANGKLGQADWDGDNIGDVCDPYPTCASNDSSCPTWDPSHGTVTTPVLVSVGAPTEAEYGEKITITVTLSSVTDENATIQLNCSGLNCARSTSIEAGTKSVSLTFTMPHSDATFTAEYDGVTITKTITGIDGSVPVAITKLTPASLTMNLNETQSVTATLSRMTKSAMSLALTSDQLSVIVPATVEIPAGSTSATFDVTTENATDGTVAKISIVPNNGADMAKLSVYVQKPLLKEYALDFADQSATGYTGNYVQTLYKDLFTITGMGNFDNDQYEGTMIMTGNKNNVSYLNVENLAGLNSLTVNYICYAKSGATTNVDIYVDTEVQDTLTCTGADTKEQSFDLTPKSNDAKSFKIQPQAGTTSNASNRIVITSIEWTTAK